jgi:hypothetical protein
MDVDTGVAAPERSPSMFPPHPGPWPLSRDDPAEERERAHRTELREARLLADCREDGLRRGALRTVADRVRLAAGLVPAEPACVACGA